jgi:hypothetical protein
MIFISELRTTMKPGGLIDSVQHQTRVSPLCISESRRGFQLPVVNKRQQDLQRFRLYVKVLFSVGNGVWRNVGV